MKKIEFQDIERSTAKESTIIKVNQQGILGSDFDTEIGLLLLVYMSDGRETFFRIDLTEDYVHYLHNKLLELETDFEALYYYAYQEIFKMVDAEPSEEIDFKGSSEYLLLSFPVIREILLSGELNDVGCFIKICEDDHSETYLEFMELEKWVKDVEFISVYGIDQYSRYRSLTNIISGLSIDNEWLLHR